MILAYNTNGFAHHHLRDAVEILAEIGYRGIALTLDCHHLDPFSADFENDLSHYQHQLEKYQLQCVVETGSRFLLNRRKKHFPTLLCADPALQIQRVDFLKRSIDIASLLQPKIVSFWSGAQNDGSQTKAECLTRLTEACKRLSDYAAKKNVRIGFEPEPGMLIETMDHFAELHDKVNHPSFGLTLDIGHLVCTQELPISKHIIKWQKWLWNIHLDDMKPQVHDHLLFGEGSVDFADFFSALSLINFQGFASIELSRHSYNAVQVAEYSYDFLQKFFTSELRQNSN